MNQPEIGKNHIWQPNSFPINVSSDPLARDPYSIFRNDISFYLFRTLRD